jgi:hypothetical protein
MSVKIHGDVYARATTHLKTAGPFVPSSNGLFIITDPKNISKITEDTINNAIRPLLQDLPSSDERKLIIANSVVRKIFDTIKNDGFFPEIARFVLLPCPNNKYRVEIVKVNMSMPTHTNTFELAD